MILHGYWRSTAAYRVRIGLNLKGQAYGQLNHDLRAHQHRDPSFLALSPQGLVPVLQTEKGVLTQSVPILEWLEERYPDPALLPNDEFDRAIVRSMAALIAADIHPVNNLRVLNALREDFAATPEQTTAWITRWIGKGFAALDRLITQHGGDYAYGDQVSLADCLIVPQVYAANRFDVDLAPYRNVTRVAACAGALEPFRAAHPDRQPDANAP
jgi:maleylpyruvate isomerase